jgi:hypothetical protein
VFCPLRIDALGEIYHQIVPLTATSYSAFGQATAAAGVNQGEQIAESRLMIQQIAFLTKRRTTSFDVP